MLGDAFSRALWAWKEVSRAFLGSGSPSDGDEAHRANPTDMAGLRNALCPVLAPNTPASATSRNSGDTSPNTFQTGVDMSYLTENYHKASAKFRRTSKKHGKHGGSHHTSSNQNHARYATDFAGGAVSKERLDDHVIVKGPTLRNVEDNEIIRVTNAVPVEDLQSDRFNVCDTLYSKGGVCERLVGLNSDTNVSALRCSSGADSGLVSCTDSENLRNDTPNNDNIPIILENSISTITCSSQLAYPGKDIHYAETASSGFSQSSSNIAGNACTPSPLDSPRGDVTLTADSTLRFCTGSPVLFRVSYDKSPAPIFAQSKHHKADSAEKSGTSSPKSSPTTPPWASYRRDDPSYIRPQKQRRFMVPSDPLDHNVFQESSASRKASEDQQRMERTSDPCNQLQAQLQGPAASDLNAPLGFVEDFQYPPPSVQSPRFKQHLMPKKTFCNPFDRDFRRATTQQQPSRFKRKVSFLSCFPSYLTVYLETISTVIGQ